MQTDRFGNRNLSSGKSFPSLCCGKIFAGLNINIQMPYSSLPGSVYFQMINSTDDVHFVPKIAGDVVFVVSLYTRMTVLLRL